MSEGVKPDDPGAADEASAARGTIWVTFALESAIARCHANESGRYAAALAIPPLTIVVGGLVAAARDRRLILYWTFVIAVIVGAAISLTVLGYWD